MVLNFNIFFLNQIKFWGNLNYTVYHQALNNKCVLLELSQAI